MSTGMMHARLAPNVIFQELDGEAVLLNLDTEHYYGLDEIGTRAWQLLVADGNVEGVVARMLTEFEVDEPTLRADIMKLLNELTAAKLIVTTSSE